MLVPTIFFVSFVWSIVAYLRVNFTTLKSYATGKDLQFSSFQVSSTYAHLYNFMALVPTTTLVMFSESHFGFMKVVLILLLFISFSFTSYSLWAGHAAAAACFVFFIGVGLIYSPSPVVSYICLEILVYLFIHLLILQSQSLANESSCYATAIWLFILNFFASIVLFISIYLNVTSIPGVTVSGWYQFLPIIALIVKGGSGPWVLVNSKIYSSLSLPTLLLYTTTFCLCILPTLLRFIGLSVTVKSMLGIVAVSYSLFLLQSSGKIVNIKHLFAFSTSILTIYIVLTLSMF